MPQGGVLFSWVLRFWLSLWLALPYLFPSSLPPLHLGFLGHLELLQIKSNIAAFFFFLQTPHQRPLARGVYFPNISISPTEEFHSPLALPFHFEGPCLWGLTFTPRIGQAYFFKKKNSPFPKGNSAANIKDFPSPQIHLVFNKKHGPWQLGPDKTFCEHFPCH